MKAPIPKTFVFLVIFAGFFYQTEAQSDSAFASRRALLYADSLVKSFQAGHINEYINISYPGIVKYYGGKHQFAEYMQRVRELGVYNDNQVELTQIINKEHEWQCVVKKINETIVDGKNAMIISYLVGQSKDEGNTWKYVDIAYNSVSNVVLIMPDVFEKIAIPQRQIIFQ